MPATKLSTLIPVLNAVPSFQHMVCDEAGNQQRYKEELRAKGVKKIRRKLGRRERRNGDRAKGEGRKRTKRPGKKYR